MGIDNSGHGSGENNSIFDFQNQASTTTASIELVDVPNGKIKLERLNVDKAVDSRIVADAHGTRVTDDPHPAFPKPPEPKRRWVRRIIVGLIVAAIVGAAVHWGVPAIKELLDTVSTDDAFVQGHITYVSPRVEGVVTEVLVDQDDRVEPGDLLVKLDCEPFDVAVAQAQASLDEARANVAQSRAQVRSQIARRAGPIIKGRTPRRHCVGRSPL